MFKRTAKPESTVHMRPTRDPKAGGAARLEAVTAQIKQCYPLEVASVSLLSSTDNDYYLVQTADQQKFVARLSPPEKDARWTSLLGEDPVHTPYDFEFSFLHHLHQRGVSCPFPVQQKDDTFYKGVSLEDGTVRTLSLQAFIEGDDAPEAPLAEDVGFCLGREVAKWHSQSAGFEWSGRQD